MTAARSTRGCFWSVLGLQLVVYAVFLVTTIWTDEIYFRYMIVFWPIGHLWERGLPWGRDRDQIAAALFVWIPLIGSLIYSLCFCLISRMLRRPRR